jgi:hypothetical protein
MTEPAQEEMTPAVPEAVAKTNGTKKNGVSPSGPDWHRGFLL